MSRLQVPTFEALRDHTDDELHDLIVRFGAAAAECQAAYVAARNEGAMRARQHYERGIRNCRAILAQRSGQPVYVKAKNVVNLTSAIEASKAIMRLLSMLWEEHEALALWLDTDPDDDRADDRLAVVEDLRRTIDTAMAAAR